MVPYYRLMKISCPVCRAKPDAECALPAGFHKARRDILSHHLTRDGGGPPIDACLGRFQRRSVTGTRLVHRVSR